MKSKLKAIPLVLAVSLGMGSCTYVKYTNVEYGCFTDSCVICIDNCLDPHEDTWERDTKTDKIIAKEDRLLQQLQQDEWVHQQLKIGRL